MADGLVLIGSEDFYVYALNASTGEVRWKYETGLGIASSPAVLGDLAAIGSKDGFLYALDVQTGQLRWKTEVGEVVTASPVITDGRIWIQAGGLLRPGSGQRKDCVEGCPRDGNSVRSRRNRRWYLYSELER